jgi:hypothetical protein
VLGKVGLGTGNAESTPSIEGGKQNEGSPKEWNQVMANGPSDSDVKDNGQTMPETKKDETNRRDSLSATWGFRFQSWSTDHVYVLRTSYGIHVPWILR